MLAQITRGAPQHSSIVTNDWVKCGRCKSLAKWKIEASASSIRVRSAWRARRSASRSAASSAASLQRVPSSRAVHLIRAEAQPLGGFHERHPRDIRLFVTAAVAVGPGRLRQSPLALTEPSGHWPGRPDEGADAQILLDSVCNYGSSLKSWTQIRNKESHGGTE